MTQKTASLGAIRSALGSAFFLQRDIEANTRRLARLRMQAERISPSYSLAPSGCGRQDKMAGALAAIIDTEALINELIVDQQRAINYIYKQLENVTDTRLRTVLWWRYGLYMSWPEIAAGLNYDMRYCYKLHKRALHELQKKWTLKDTR